MAAYQERDYRVACGRRGLAAFTARAKETDLWIQAERELCQEAVDSIMNHRRALEAYLRDNPEFLSSLSPLPDDDLAPPLARTMINAGRLAGVGPMAAVAGALAEAVAGDLMRLSPQVAVENGGDTFLALDQDLTVGIWAGKSPLSGRVGLAVAAGDMPLSVCTSSGTVGHSLSLGRADAATVVAKDADLADAVATALGNRAGNRGDLAPALDWVQTVDGVLGALIILDDRLAAWGQITLVDLKESRGK